MPEFYMILARQNTLIFMISARKIYKILEFYMIFARKMPEFYTVIARKIFFPNFREGETCPLPPAPVSYAYVYPQLTCSFFGVLFDVSAVLRDLALNNASSAHPLTRCVHDFFC